MARYTTLELPKSKLLNYVTFAVWDNTAGPSTKRVWAQLSHAPDVDQIKLLARLVLKTEVTRDPSLPYIDCNIYNLPTLGACAVSYLFGGVSKSKYGKTVYCITCVYDMTQRHRYLQWSDILDSMLKQNIAKYKILLHKDFEARCTDTSIGFLDQMVLDFVKLINRLDATHLQPDLIQVEDTAFIDTKAKDTKFLEEVISSMVLSFGRVVVVGSVKDQSIIDKWVNTLTAVLPSQDDQQRCFTCGLTNQSIIPNAMVQGISTTDDILNSDENLLTLFTICNYPVTIAMPSKREVYRTSTYTLHQIHRQNIIDQLYGDLYSTGTLILSPRLKKMLKEFEKWKDLEVEGSLISTLLKEVYMLKNPQARLGYLSQYMGYLSTKAMALINYVRYRMCKDSKNDISRANIGKYQFIPKDDVEIVLCLAEMLEPGVFECVEDVDNKSKLINHLI